MAYVDTLYGHQSEVTGIDCYLKERPISIGRDRTARAWKIAEETHLIFRGGSKALSADCVSVIKDDWFVTGHEDGNISLWTTEKKKAVATVQAAHGPTSPMIVCCDALKGSDLAASGSSDGYLRLWKVSITFVKVNMVKDTMRHFRLYLISVFLQITSILSDTNW